MKQMQESEKLITKAMPAESPTSICKSSYHLVFILLLTLSTIANQQACHVHDQQSLLLLAASFSSSPSLNWSTASDCCSSWEGIGCSDKGRVIRLWLPSRGLKGNISPSLVSLTSLSQLNFSGNLLSGFFPDGLFASLTRLEIIDFSSNRLYGSLSASFGSNGSFPGTIQIVDVSNNQFHGAIEPAWFAIASNLSSLNASNTNFNAGIPSSICISCPQLETLDFSSAAFGGQIPAGQGGCSQLKVFRAGFNSLSGLLPDDIYSLKSLVELSVPVNNISGDIAAEMLGLTNLRILELYSNNLSGVIPHDIGRLSNLQYLKLHENKLRGHIPASLLNNCTNLVKLVLQMNSLQGNVSELDFSRLVLLEVLDLGNNYFTGNLPESILSCTSLTEIRLPANYLTGRLLPNLKALTSLSYLSISTNNFTNVSETIKTLAGCTTLITAILSENFYHEALPSEKNLIEPEQFRNLRILALGGCDFVGQIPTWLVNIKSLEALDLSFNRITGRIPDWLGSLPNLFYLDLAANSLSDSVTAKMNRTYLDLPVFVSNSATTKRQYRQVGYLPPVIHLMGNQFTGTIPVEICQLQNLIALDLSNNHFSGGIPAELSNLTNLEVLDLSLNNFTDEIPTSLQSLCFLSDFNVSYNNLQGQIPTENQFATFTENNYIGNPGLCGRVLRSCFLHTVLGTPGTEETKASEATGATEHFLDGFTIGVVITFIAVLAIQTYRLRKILYCKKRKINGTVQSR